MTDLARKALLAAIPALAVAAASPASAGAFAEWLFGDAAATAPSASSPSETSRAKPPQHRRRRHAARDPEAEGVEGAKLDAAKPDGARPDGAKPDRAKPDGARSEAGPAGSRREDEAGRRTAGMPKPAKPAGSGPTVLGDSIGIGLSMASGAPRLAHEGVAIRSAAALAQLQRVPERSTVVLSLGTNDAVGSIRGVEGAIDRIRDVAERNDLRVVWLGPPCVFKSWNGTAERLDAVLKERLGADRRVRYVSAADAAVCDRSLRAGDGVHFTMKGYAMLWKRVVAAEGDWAARPAHAPDRTAANDR